MSEETVVIAEPETKPEPAKAPTKDELAKKGWTDREIESAEKHGMVSKPEEKPSTELKKDPVEDPVKEEKPKPSQNGNLPDFAMTPEQEKVFFETFGPGTSARAMYVGMKNERKARQEMAKALELERKSKADLEARIKALETGKPAPAPEPKLDADGNPIDPDNKPLTVKQLKELEKQKEEERQKREQETREIGQKVAVALREQEETAKEVYEDFEHTVGLAKDLLQRLDELVPDTKKRNRIILLYRDLEMAAAHAHELGPDDVNATDLSYEIGKYHPDYGSKNGHRADIDGKSERPGKANGGLTPEEMERVKKNTQRGISSAAVPSGSGKRVVSADDVTLSELNKMTYLEREKFKEKHPDRYAKLLRG